MEQPAIMPGNNAPINLQQINLINQLMNQNKNKSLQSASKKKGKIRQASAYGQRGSSRSKPKKSPRVKKQIGYTGEQNPMSPEEIYKLLKNSLT